MHLPKKVLIAPLDWGLGHATRCMPIIDFFLQHHTEIHIASNGRALLLLQETYPHLQFHELPPYDIQYVKRNSAWVLLLQAPKVYTAIRKEHDAVETLQSLFGYDLIISDNRYGVYHQMVKSILICHQLKLLPPKNLRFTAPIFWRLHKKRIYAFDELWIPDDTHSKWAGIMAHGLAIDIPHYYTGILSRFSKRNTITPIDGRILVILSGLEPQRTILEQKIMHQAQHLTSYHFTIVRGITEDKGMTLQKNMTLIDHLTTKELETLILESEVVIARPGYSTVMDMAMVEKKTIFIPTPGQTEQEYLAEHLAERNMSIVQKQDELDLAKAINSSKNFEGHLSGRTNIAHFLRQYFSYTQ